MRAISSCSEKVLWTFPQAQSGKRRKEEERTLFFLERQNQRTFVLSLIAHSRHLVRKTRQSLSASFVQKRSLLPVFVPAAEAGFPSGFPPIRSDRQSSGRIRPFSRASRWLPCLSGQASAAKNQAAAFRLRLPRDVRETRSDSPPPEAHRGHRARARPQARFRCAPQSEPGRSLP